MKWRSDLQRVRYLGPAHVLITSEGAHVDRGEVVEVSDREADFMASSPHTWIEFVDSSLEEKWGFPVGDPDRPEAVSGEGQSTEVEM